MEKAFSWFSFLLSEIFIALRQLTIYCSLQTIPTQSKMFLVHHVILQEGCTLKLSSVGTTQTMLRPSNKTASRIPGAIAYFKDLGRAIILLKLFSSVKLLFCGHHAHGYLTVIDQTKIHEF